MTQELRAGFFQLQRFLTKCNSCENSEINQTWSKFCQEAKVEKLRDQKPKLHLSQDMDHREALLAIYKLIYNLSQTKSSTSKKCWIRRKEISSRETQNERHGKYWLSNSS